MKNRSRLSLFGTVRAAFFGPFTKTEQVFVVGGRPFEDERAAIEGRIAAGFSGYPVFWGNVPHRHVRTSHVVANLRPQSAEKMAIGRNGLHRYRGTIRFELATPEKQGTKEARTMADTLDPIIGNAKFSFGNSGQITTGVPWYETRGIENGWYRATLSVDYRRDKVF